MKTKKIIAVIGGSSVSNEIYDISYKAGKIIAEKGHILVCGGKGGVMEAAAKGAKEKNGLTIGILPGSEKDEANEFIDIPIPTGISHARNAIIAQTCDMAISVDGKYGTLSEIAFCLNLQKTVLGLKTHNIEGVVHLDDVEKIGKYLDRVLDL